MRDVLDIINTIETNESDKLIKFVYDDLWIWTNIRINLWSMITPEYKERTNKKRGNIKLQRIKNMFKTILNLKEYIKLMLMKKSDILMFTYTQYRRDFVDGYHRDIYFQHLIEYLETKGIKYTVISLGDDTFHRYKIRERKHVIFRQPFIFMSKIRSMFTRIDKKIPKDLRDLALELQQKYDVPIISALSKTIKDYIINKRVYQRFINRINPKLVFMVPSISKESLISICKKRNITTIEGEHGTYLPILHSYTDNLKKMVLKNELLTQAPDYYLCFGRNTKEQLDKHSLIKSDNIRAIGNTRIDYFKKRSTNAIKEDNTIRILVTSQFTVTDELIEFLSGVNDYLISSNTNNIMINVKLHFNEMHRFEHWKKAESSYLRVLDRDEEKSHSLYEMILKSDFVASVYSTTLIESVSFNQPTLILKLWGWEPYTEHIEKGILLPIETPEEFVKTVLEYKSDEKKNLGLKDKMTDYNTLVNTEDAVNNYLKFFDELYRKDN